MYSRAGSMPPITSTIRCERSRMSSKSPRLRVSTPLISGRCPVAASIASARASSNSWNADPTVPWPSRPTLKDVTEREVLVALAAHDGPRVPVLAEDHRRARDAVVVVGHRMAVGAGGGHDQQVAGLRVVQLDVPLQHVAGLAVLAGDRADRAAAEAVRDLGLVARPVEHRPEVVGHAAVDRHVGAHAGDL